MSETSIDLGNLDELNDNLDDDQRKLLAGIIAVAAKALRGKAPGDDGPPWIVETDDPPSTVTVEVEGGDLPTLGEQIAQAFKPGPITGAEDAELLVRIGHVRSLKVGRGS